MKIHQIQSTYNTGEVNYRILSCFCESSDTKGFCNCFLLKKHCLIMPNRKNQRQKRHLPETTDAENRLLNTKHYIVTARSDENTSTFTDSIKLPSMRKRQIIMSSDDDEDIFTSQKKLKQLLIIIYSRKLNVLL